MADTKTTTNASGNELTEELNNLAFQIFSMGKYANRSPKENAIKSYRDAKFFLEVKAEILSGKIDVFAEDNNPLDPGFAPNLKKTHPINLMSREWGNIDKIRKVLDELDENPTMESYEPYSWGKPEVNQARALFPVVLKKAGIKTKKQTSNS